MGRRARRSLLQVLMNNRQVGTLLKQPNGAVEFRYAPAWLNNESAFPVSLSLPLREDAYRGAAVAAVFDNLLPDSQVLRRKVADRVGATGYDSYSLLEAIGRDCVGAMQFLPADETLPLEAPAISGREVGEEEIERLLQNLAQAPLGLQEDDDFRISLAGMQEKTALLRHDGHWLVPHGTTPTTHIFKKELGHLPDGIVLPDSVENEFYCLKLLDAFGLPVNRAEIHTFGETKALVIERFDRLWTQDGRLLRLPQEDCCQALSEPPSRKYQADGGPGMLQILEVLKGSDDPMRDMVLFLKAQILFWLMGATDGHAKNFSIAIRPGGRFRMTSIYDVLTVQPLVDAGKLDPHRMKLAMSVGRNRHYRIEEVHGRHFVQTVMNAALSWPRVPDLLEEVADTMDIALEAVQAALPAEFPMQIAESVTRAMQARRDRLRPR